MTLPTFTWVGGRVVYAVHGSVAINVIVTLCGRIASDSPLTLRGCVVLITSLPHSPNVPQLASDLNFINSIKYDWRVYSVHLGLILALRMPLLSHGKAT